MSDLEDPDVVRAELARVLASEAFREARRSRRLLEFIVEATLEGRGTTLKEFTLGADALERGPGFDPRTDPIARVEASRLRTRLAQYYADEGAANSLRITLPKGTYVPVFARPPASARSMPALVDSPSWGRSAVLAVVASAIAATAVWFLARRDGVPPAVRGAAAVLEFDAGAAGVDVASHVGNDFALSASGELLVFVGRKPQGDYALFARDMTSLTARELAGTQGARSPVLSPDGQWVAFWADGEVRKTRTDGAERPTKLTATADLLGGSWGEDGRIVAALDRDRLVSIDASTGETAVLPEAPGQRRVWPQALARQGLILYTSESGQMGGAAIEAMDVRTGQRTELVRGALYGRYTASGYLLFVRDGTLFGVELDVRALELRGEPVPIASGVAWSPTFGYAQYAVADNGLLVLRSTGDGADTEAAWLDDEGVVRLPEISGLLQWPRLSPDGRSLAVMRRDADDYDLWVYSLETRVGRKIADQPSDLQAPVWTRDGRFVLYAASGAILWSAADASASGVFLRAAPEPQIVVPWSTSPEDRALAYYVRGTGGSFDLWVASIEHAASGLVAARPEVFVATAAFETYPAISPDGRALAYTSFEYGRQEIYVRPFPGGGQATRVAALGGGPPVWSRDSTELYYLSEDRRVMSVDYDSALATGAARRVSASPLADTGVIASYDVGPDGRVIALLPAEPVRSAGALVLVTDFRELLERGASRRVVPAVARPAP
jgi:serine/threonine-protein kinase